jgi:hypothetical protein
MSLMQHTIPLLYFYNQEIKGLGLGFLLLLITAVLNNYIAGAMQLLPAHNLWLYSLFFVAAIVITLLLQIYHLVMTIAGNRKTVA